MGLVQDLIEAKKKAEWRPVVLVEWPDAGRYSIFREPRTEEVKFYADLYRAFPGCAESIWDEFHIKSNFDLNQAEEAGYLHFPVGHLLRWASSDPRELNRHLADSRARLSRFEDMIDSRIRTLETQTDFKAEGLTFTEVLRHLFSIERVEQAISKGESAPFRMTSPEMEEAERVAAMWEKTNRIVEKAPEAPPAERPLPTVDQVREMQRRKMDKNIGVLRPRKR